MQHVWFSDDELKFLQNPSSVCSRGRHGLQNNTRTHGTEANGRKGLVICTSTLVNRDVNLEVDDYHSSLLSNRPWQT